MVSFQQERQDKHACRFFNKEVIYLSRYSDAFKRNAVDLLHNVGISKACREVRVTRATLYRWNREISLDESCPHDNSSPATIEMVATDANTERSIPTKPKLRPTSIEDELCQLRTEIDKQATINRKLKKALMTILSDGD